jgi:hypothetical protein
MATPSTVTEIANISQYLWSAKLAKDAAFGNGNSNINSGRDLVLFVENAALEYGIAQSLDGVQGVANDVYRLCGAELQKANEILNSGSSGGIIVNTSTGVSTFVPYYADFVVGDVDSPILDGETSYTINIGIGRTWNVNTMIITKDQILLPINKSGYVTYTATYDTVTGLVTITFSDAVANGQLFTVQFSYLIV